MPSTSSRPRSVPHSLTHSLTQPTNQQICTTLLCLCVGTDQSGSDCPRECGGRGPDSNPGPAVDHHPQVPDWIHRFRGGRLFPIILSHSSSCLSSSLFSTLSSLCLFSSLFFLILLLRPILCLFTSYSSSAAVVLLISSPFFCICLTHLQPSSDSCVTPPANSIILLLPPHCHHPSVFYLFSSSTVISSSFCSMSGRSQCSSALGEGGSADMVSEKNCRLQWS